MTRRTTRSIRRSARRGFTIIEVMVVLVILGLIGGIVALNLVGASNQARVDTTKQSMKSVVTALNMYHTRNATYPPASEWRQAIANTLQGPAEDAWGNPLEYHSMQDGKSFLIYSNGEDGLPETADDIMMGPDGEAVGPE